MKNSKFNSYFWSKPGCHQLIMVSAILHLKEIDKLAPAPAPELCTALHEVDCCRRWNEEVFRVCRTQLVITVQSAHDPVVVRYPLSLKFSSNIMKVPSG